jgi:NAD-dependent deacetylase
MESLIQQTAAWILQARSVVVLSGAGMSAESGLSTFRDPEEGLWSQYDPMELATIDAFERNPELVTRWYHWRFTKASDVQPNPGHRALAELEAWFAARDDRAQGLTVVTQNIDGLHQRAGSKRVIEIHGTIHRWRCTKTGVEMPLSEVSFEQFPVRSAAGGLMRPCVVWFGEMLPETALQQCQDALKNCDVFLSIGTSGTVFPAASFVHQARSSGAKAIEINKDLTPISGSVDACLLGKSGVLIPEILKAVVERGEHSS